MALYGYNSNGFASHRLEEALIILAENGMRAVAITPDVPHLDPRTSTSSEVKNIAKLCKDLNLVVIIETGARYVLDSKRKHRPNLLESDESRMVRIRFLQQMLEWCDIFESPVLSFWSGTLPEGQDESLARCLFLDAVCSLKNSAPKTLEFAIEPEPGHLISTLSDFTSLEPELPAGVGLCLDIGHLLVNDVYTPAEAIKKHADIIKTVQLDELAQALRSIGEPIFGQSVKDISGGKLLKQLFNITEKFNMQTQPQLLLLQKTMVVVEGVARKLNPNTNIWSTSKPVLEKWLKQTKDPINNISETLKETSEVIKRLPEFPKMMDKANQALSYLASGKIPDNSNSYSALKEKELELKSFRNQSFVGLLLLVFFAFIVF